MSLLRLGLFGNKHRHLVLMHSNLELTAVGFNREFLKQQLGLEPTKSFSFDLVEVKPKKPYKKHTKKNRALLQEEPERLKMQKTNKLVSPAPTFGKIYSTDTFSAQS